MKKAITIRKHLDSHVLNVPELAALVGVTVDIIVLHDADSNPMDLSALDSVAGTDAVDEDAILGLRRFRSI